MKREVLEDVDGVREWRFVADRDWAPPRIFKHLDWYFIDPASTTTHALPSTRGKLLKVPPWREMGPLTFATEREMYQQWRERLDHAKALAMEPRPMRDGVIWPDVGWYHDGKVVYVATVSYDAVKRSVLVCVGGFR